MSIRPRSTSGPARSPGCTVWLTGLPSSGKSTIATAVAARLLASGHQVEVLDGDQVRIQLGDLPFNRAGRDLNVRRIGWLATVLARNGVTVLVAAIAPYRAARESVRTLHLTEGIPFVEVYVAAPVGVCADRDVKGLYARQRAGAIKGLTGVDDPYEAPLDPEIVLHTDSEDVVRSMTTVMTFLSKQGLV